MNILYVWDADYPWDVRAEKICRTLGGHGYGVHIAARNLKRSPTFEVLNGIGIHRLDPWKTDRVNYALSFPAFFNPLWRRFLDRTIEQAHIDLLIVRDLPMAMAAIWAGRRHGIPVIFDMAEDYVAMIRDIWRARKFQGFNMVVRNPFLAGIVERYSLRHADHVLVVVEESRDRLTARGVPEDRISLVGNTPPLSVFEPRTATAPDLERIRANFSAIYTGGVQMGRGVQVVLQAIPEIVSRVPDFLFVVAGAGYAVPRLQVLARTLGVERHVHWTGWVEHDRLFDYLRVCRVGVIPHFATAHVNTTIPNKVFDYMGAGLPVVSSDAVPLKRILESEGCGVVFRSGDASDFARKIVMVHDSGRDFGARGIAAVRDRYNWERDTERLVAAVGWCLRAR